MVLLSLLLVMRGAWAAPSVQKCAKPWIFFDLGNTIVDTRVEDRVKYMPGARDYVRDLRRKDYHVGLIVNVPEHWGKTEAEKVAALKKFINDRWSDSVAMDWGVFDAGVLVPRSDQERKPDPVLFEKAMKLARSQGCEAVFQGETPREVSVARGAGMHSFETGRPGRVYLPEREITRFVRVY